MAEEKQNNIREELLSRGTGWLLEMELLNNPNVKNFLYLNTYNASKRIKTVELLVDTNYKVLLFYLELDWLGRLFRKEKEIEEYLLEQYQLVLPTFRTRVVFDRKIFDMALKKAEELAKGGSNEKRTKNTGGSVSQPVASVPQQSNSSTGEAGKSTGDGALDATAPSTEAVGQVSQGISASDSEGIGSASNRVETDSVNSESGIEPSPGPTKLPEE